MFCSNVIIVYFTAATTTMSIGEKVSYVAPLLRSLGRSVQDEDIPFDEYRITVMGRFRDAFQNVTMAKINNLIAKNNTLWVSQNCFIIKSFLGTRFRKVLRDRNFLPNSYSNEIYEVTVYRKKFE
jgi:hypothetical protein